MMELSRFFADVVVVVHATYIAFVVFGLVAILLGVALRWQWIGNVWFRLSHLLAIAIVAIQSVLGIICPLTILENRLREQAGQEGYGASFIAYWTHELIFYKAPPWVFMVCYCLFAAAVVAMLVLSPPHWPRKHATQESRSA
jgi:hypothetical protein